MDVANETIAQYVAAMEKAQKRVLRANNPITNATLVKISTKAMLTTEHFPKADEK